MNVTSLLKTSLQTFLLCFILKDRTKKRKKKEKEQRKEITKNIKTNETIDLLYNLTIVILKFLFFSFSFHLIFVEDISESVVDGQTDKIIDFPFRRTKFMPVNLYT